VLSVSGVMANQAPVLSSEGWESRTGIRMLRAPGIRQNEMRCVLPFPSPKCPLYYSGLSYSGAPESAASNPGYSRGSHALIARNPSLPYKLL
jgi:hypothetical protein